MATPISSHVKDKNSIFTAYGEDMKDMKIVKGKILVCHQYLYNKYILYLAIFFADKPTLQNKLFDSEVRQSATFKYHIFLNF